MPKNAILFLSSRERILSPIEKQIFCCDKKRLWTLFTNSGQSLAIGCWTMGLIVYTRFVPVDLYQRLQVCCLLLCIWFQIFGKLLAIRLGAPG